MKKLKKAAAIVLVAISVTVIPLALMAQTGACVQDGAGNCTPCCTCGC